MSAVAMRASLIALALVFGCSSKSDSEEPSGGNQGNEDGGGGGSSSQPEPDSGSTSSGSGDAALEHPPEDDAPVGDDLQLLFSPAYSAYDGGEHDFKVPCIVQGGLEGLKWSARPADAVYFEPDQTTGGVLITTAAAGEVLIIARAGALSGSATLHITDTTPELWRIGQERYNNEIPFPDFNIPDGGFDGGVVTADGGLMFEIPDNLQCSNCHGGGAEALGVEHTPQQTGGYSDEQLIRIFTMGEKPSAARFRTPIPDRIYVMFHTWEATEEERKGLVTYLRSLTPATQGALDFQGLREQFM